MVPNSKNAMIAYLIALAALGLALLPVEAASWEGRSQPHQQPEEGSQGNIIQDSATSFEIVRSAVDGQSRRLLCRRLEAESDFRQDAWTVRFESGFGELFAAHVIVAAGRASVSGVVGSTAFHYAVALRENDVMFLSRSFGDLHVSVEFNLADRHDPRNELAANHLEQYETALTNRLQWRTAVGSVNDTVSDMLGASSHVESVGRVVLLAIDSMGSSIGIRSIESYMECLREACKHDGGCWSNSGCHACERDTRLVQTFAFILYTIDAEICFLREILNPIRW